MKDWVWVVEQQDVLNNYKYRPVEGCSFNTRESARQTARVQNQAFANKARVRKYVPERK